MGVYIKGLNKKDISDLRVHKYGGAYEYIDYENIVEVKAPHGRLIDAGKWHKRLQKQAMTLYESDHRTYALIMDIMDAIHTEPTVIEGEN